jgi:hypothetical protein
MADYSPYITAGLSGAQNTIKGNTYTPMTAYSGNQMANPYANQTQASQYAGTGYDPSMTAYQGIGQNNDQIRADFMAPVNQAWNSAQTAINNKFGANGMYGSLGSGLMSGAMGDAAQNYMTGTAQANTMANQQIMTNDMNRVNAGLDSYKLAGDQGLNQWTANQAANEYNNGLNQQNAAWGNQQISDKFAYDEAARADKQAYNQQQIENYLGLAGGSTPANSAQLQANAANYSANQQAKAAQQSANAQTWGGILGGLGSLGGGLLSGAGQAGGFGNLFSW